METTADYHDIVFLHDKTFKVAKMVEYINSSMDQQVPKIMFPSHAGQVWEGPFTSSDMLHIASTVERNKVTVTDVMKYILELVLGEYGSVPRRKKPSMKDDFFEDYENKLLRPKCSFYRTYVKRDNLSKKLIYQGYWRMNSKGQFDPNHGIPEMYDNVFVMQSMYETFIRLICYYNLLNLFLKYDRITDASNLAHRNMFQMAENMMKYLETTEARNYFNQNELEQLQSIATHYNGIILLVTDQNPDAITYKNRAHFRIQQPRPLKQPTRSRYSIHSPESNGHQAQQKKTRYSSYSLHSPSSSPDLPVPPVHSKHIPNSSVFKKGDVIFVEDDIPGIIYDINGKTALIYFYTTTETVEIPISTLTHAYNVYRTGDEVCVINSKNRNSLKGRIDSVEKNGVFVTLMVNKWSLQTKKTHYSYADIAPIQWAKYFRITDTWKSNNCEPVFLSGFPALSFPTHIADVKMVLTYTGLFFSKSSRYLTPAREYYKTGSEVHFIYVDKNGIQTVHNGIIVSEDPEINTCTIRVGDTRQFYVHFSRILPIGLDTRIKRYYDPAGTLVMYSPQRHGVIIPDVGTTAQWTAVPAVIADFYADRLDLTLVQSQGLTVHVSDITPVHQYYRIGDEVRVKIQRRGTKENYGDLITCRIHTINVDVETARVDVEVIAHNSTKKIRVSFENMVPNKDPVLISWLLLKSR